MSGQEKVIVIADESLSCLVVDDNRVSVTMADSFLSRHNIKADCAYSGSEALKMIEEKDFDIIFMDHLMPEMDGIETAKRIRELGKRTPIIALSANTSNNAEKIFLDAGMNDFILKPIVAVELNRVLGQWLPAGKISCKETNSDAEEPLSNGLLEELSGIRGLDVKTGMENSGQNQKGYFLALRQFLENSDSYIEELLSALKAEAWKDYLIKAHALKGVLAALGLSRLSQWAANLEEASREAENLSGENISGETPSLDICREETSHFCEAMEKFINSLRQTSLLDSFDIELDNISTGEKEYYMGERKIILVVDDMAENLTIMRSMLQDYFDVRLAKSGKMALSLLDDVKVDLILLDIEMPAMSGFELIRRVKSYDGPNKKTPIIFVTSHADAENIHDAITAGAKDYVLKPVKAEALFKKIDAIIGMPEHKLNSLDGNINFLKAAVIAGDSARCESLLKELLTIVKDQNVHKRQYAQDIAKLLLALEYEKGLEKIESFINYLSRARME